MMQTQRNQVKRAVGGCALIAVLGFSLLAFAGDLGFPRAPALTVAAPAGPPIAPAAFPATLFVKFDGIDGEATDPSHRGWSHVLSFGQSHSRSVARAVPGTAASRVAFENLLLTKELDKASPKLAEAVCRATVFPKVEIHAAQSLGTGSLIYYKYELKNVIVTSYHIGGTQGTVPIDEVALSFEEIKVTYTEYDASGRAKGIVEYSWKV